MFVDSWPSRPHRLAYEVLRSRMNHRGVVSQQVGRKLVNKENPHGDARSAEYGG